VLLVIGAEAGYVIIAVMTAAAMVTQIGDIAIALLMDGRLVGAARLQIAVADEAHI